MSADHAIAIIPTSHLDLFWLGDYRNCLRRGDQVIASYLDRAVTSDETFVIDTAIFAEHFLTTHPEYEQVVRDLLADGRLEIGAAYIDRWENLVLGETLIRNVQIGRRWLRDRLGVDGRLAAHPDLPGLNAQTAQIYAQAGIEYYVTSRKIFQEGRVWRHRAPDGTALTMLTWPHHYVFLALDEDGLDPHGDGNFAGDAVLSTQDLAERYPHGTIAVSGSAGDLTAADDFLTRYGKDIQEYVKGYRDKPFDIGFSIPGRVLAPYLESNTGLVEVSGSLPSVWGVAPDEEMRFFHRVRATERLLLDAETASVLGVLSGRDPLPASAASWRGLYGEDAFFADDDRPPTGREWEWLWRMHAFTQDHNGGGQDGTLSIFQKKVRHDRTADYAAEVIEHALGGDDRAPSVLRTRLGPSEEAIVLDSDVLERLRPWLEGSSEVQLLPDGGFGPRGALALAPAAGVGVGPLQLRAGHSPLSAVSHDDEIVVANSEVSVRVDRATGRVSLHDRRRDRAWSGIIKAPYAVPELGNDVTLRTDEGARSAARVESVELSGLGHVAAVVRIRWRLLQVTWTADVRVWADSSRVDVDLAVRWPALERWQIRLPLGRLPRADVSHGTPFHGSGWEDLPRQQNSRMADEISIEDMRAYREVQQWVHQRRGDSGLMLATSHPAFRHDGQELSAVLLRTAPSCGDSRMLWTNPGLNTWSFAFDVADADWRAGQVAERADRWWRMPRLVAGSVGEIDVLGNSGDPIRISALYLRENGHLVARLVNESALPAEVALTGDVVRDRAELVDLADRVQQEVEEHEGALRFTVPPWRIQTVDLGKINRELP
ncbi:hypothetical protein ACIBL3_37290 [Kribbella sp. NPDC050124]|uniref:glycoside hydrolase family 38 N-terminal domain-containing protein n=1 Tax=Kribbella sp. NPDC050124 TaxID=3364114 RepID=UPI00378EE05C